MHTVEIAERHDGAAGLDGNLCMVAEKAHGGGKITR